MNFNPLDILIILILVVFTLSGLKNKFIKTSKTTINLILSIIVAGVILENFKLINIISHQNEILNLFILILIIIISSLIIGFLLDFAIYQLENLELDTNADRILGSLIGLVRGFVIIAFLIFIFDKTPLTNEMKNKVTDKISQESFFYAPCDNLKSILFK